MTGDEIVITMSERDFDILREMWMSAYYGARKKDREKYRRAILRLCHTAETLTLSWLDRKLAEFP